MEKKFDIVLETLKKERNHLWKMTKRNLNSEYVGLNIIDDIRLRQIEELDKAIETRKEQTALNKTMNNYEEYAWCEFKAAGWVDENNQFKDEMQELICKHVLKLIEVFSEEGHSGSTAPYAISLFKKIASFKPITPLTGEDDEWNDVGHYGGDIHYQNKRMSSVFKESKDSQAYWIDGRVFWEWFKREDGTVSKIHYTNRDSRVYIDFPWSEPEHPEYVFVPTEEFPNESLIPMDNFKQ